LRRSEKLVTQQLRGQIVFHSTILRCCFTFPH